MKSLSKIRKVSEQGELIQASDLFADFTIPEEEEETESPQAEDNEEESEKTVSGEAARRLIQEAW